MPKLPELLEPPSPWLTFFREVRRLAAELDAREQAEAKDKPNKDRKILSS